MNSLVALIAVVAMAASGADAGDAVPDNPTTVERIVQKAVGSVLSMVLDTPTTVEGVRLDPETKGIELRGLRIANPKGFQAEEVISLEKAVVTADLKSLFSKEPIINVMEVSGATVNAEMDITRGINLKKLLDRVSKLKMPKLGPEKRWKIDKALVQNATFNVRTPIPGKENTQKTIESFETSLAGPDGRGVTTNEAVTFALQTLLDKSGMLEGTGAGSLLEPLSGLLQR